MFSSSIRWLLFLSSWQTLTGALAHVTTLFVYTQNLGFGVGEASLFMTSMGLIIGVYRIIVTPVLDDLVSPWMLLGSTVAVAVGRGILVIELVWHHYTRSTEALFLLPITLLGIAAAQILASTSVSLAMKRAAERDAPLAKDRGHDNAEYVRTYGVAYSFDNISSGLALLLFQAAKWTEPSVLVANLLLVLYGSLAALAAVPLVVLVWPILERNAHDYERLKRLKRGSAPSRTSSPWQCLGARTGSPFLRELRYMLPLISVNMILLLSNVGFLFNDTVLPYVMMSHSDAGRNAPFTLVQLLNMVLIIFLAPTVQIASARRISNYSMLVGGTFLSALSNLFLLFGDPSAIWPYVAYMVVFSIAESVWSARVTAYNLHMSPRGREATYMAAVSVPVLVGTLFLRLGIGYAVEHLCPVGAVAAACAARSLWAIALALAATSPVALFVLRNLLDKPPAPSRLD